MRLSASVTAVLLFLVLSLAAVGAGYGLWTKTLAVQGTVQTGDFNAKFTAASTNDPPVNAAGDPVVSPDPCTPDLNPTGCTAPAKDVGSCTATIIRRPHWAEPREVKVVVSNAYPGYECEVEVTIAKGVTTFFEIGPGDVLTGLIKRISPGAQTFNINTLDSLNAITNWRKG